MKPDRTTGQVISRGWTRDDRGRRVPLLDPVTISIARRHDLIDREALEAIHADVGTGLQQGNRGLLHLLTIGAVALGLVLAVRLVEVAIGGRLGALFDRTTVLLFFAWIGPVVLWSAARTARLRRVRSVMLRHGRCPHCGYPLREIPPDPADGAVVCAECGCGWQLPVADVNRQGS